MLSEDNSSVISTQLKYCVPSFSWVTRMGIFDTKILGVPIAKNVIHCFDSKNHLSPTFLVFQLLVAACTWVPISFSL